MARRSRSNASGLGFLAFLAGCSAGPSSIGDSATDASVADGDIPDGVVPTVESGGLTDAGDAGASVDAVPSDDAFVPAPHTPLPRVVMHSGPVLAHPQLVTITFDGDPYADQLESFGDYVVSSNWLRTVGAEYGVSTGEHLARARWASAPATLTDSEIGAMIRTRIVDGTLPAPGGANANVVYMVYVPPTTTITDSDGSVSCDGFFGYHSARSTNSVPYAYAVIADCNTGIADVMSTATHEIIEAATDPYDAPNEDWYVDADAMDPWSAEYGTEVADLCEDEANATADGFTLQRSWSNLAAAMDQPCVPVIPGEVYFNVSASPSTVPTADAGSTVMFELTGWSMAPVADWMLSLDTDDGSDLDFVAMNPTLSATTVNNGQRVRLALSVPASAVSGSVGAVRVYSDGRRYWPVVFRVR